MPLFMIQPPAWLMTAAYLPLLKMSVSRALNMENGPSRFRPMNCRFMLLIIAFK